MASVSHQALLMQGAGHVGIDGWVFPLSVIPQTPIWREKSPWFNNYGAWLAAIPYAPSGVKGVQWQQPLSARVPSIVRSLLQAPSITDASSYAGSWITPRCTPTTWNPDDKSANITLSNGNLTASYGDTTTDAGVRCTDYKATGLFYFEFSVNNTLTGGDAGVGVSISTSLLANVANLASGAVIVYRSGAIWTNGSPSGLALASIAGSGTIIGCAINQTSKKAWFRIAPGGNWNGQVIGSQDPAGGIGGVTIPVGSVTPVATFGGVGGTNVPNNFTINAGRSAFIDTVPSGFTSGWTNCGAVAGGVSWQQPLSVPPMAKQPYWTDASSYAAIIRALYVSWDPSTITAVTLSGDNLVATNTGTNPVNQGAHVNFSGKTTGKWYVEIAFTTITSANGSNLGVGIGTTASNFSQMGASALHGNMCYQSGNLWADGSSTGVSLGTRASGDVIGIAADLDNRKIWFKKVNAVAGNWNNSGLADPATNVGGQTIPSGTLVPFTTFGGTGGLANNVVTLNAGATGFVSAAPSGFVGWSP